MARPVPGSGWQPPVEPPGDPAQLAADLIDWLRGQANPDNVAGMARYGISSEGTLGVPVAVLRGIARQLRPWRRARPDYIHQVAADLWASGVHEARILAGIIDIPALVTPEQADAWVEDIDSWDVCDQVQDLFVPTDFAYTKAVEWCGADEVFVKRSGFVLICALAVHDKRAQDSDLIAFLSLVERECIDERNYVKKAVNWALRQIGKRSPACHAAALASGERILADHADSKAARWIARDGLRELRSDQVLARLARQHP